MTKVVKYTREVKRFIGQALDLLHSRKCLALTLLLQVTFCQMKKCRKLQSQNNCGDWCHSQFLHHNWILGLILSQMPRSFTTRLQLVPASERTFLEEFLAGHELKFLSRKVHAHFIRNSCLAFSQMTYIMENVCTHIIPKLGSSSFIRHMQMIKNSASEYFMGLVWYWDPDIKGFLWLGIYNRKSQPLSRITFGHC